jgi:hypothetical protein|tara:strand:+ start:3132 stop:3263 length:132 start_codon:yes stop_codon:yes gene_type:complete
MTKLTNNQEREVALADFYSIDSDIISRKYRISKSTLKNVIKKK